MLALCLAIALLASVTLAPALLRAIGPRVFWPWGIHGRPNAAHAGHSVVARSPVVAWSPDHATGPTAGLPAPAPIDGQRQAEETFGRRNVARSGDRATTGAGDRPTGAGDRATTGPEHRAATEEPVAALGGGMWHRLAGLILARPGLLLAVSLAVLIPLAARGVGIEINYDLVSELSRDCRSVQGLRLAEG